MRATLLVLAGVLGVSSPALAGGLEAKASRNPMPSREVERPLVLPRGWYELSLTYDQHLGTGAWTSEGERDPFEHASWTYFTQEVSFRFGFANRGELWWTMPFHQALFSSDLWPEDEPALFDMSIGDPRFGARYSILRKDAPLTDVALSVWYKGPAAQESPGTYIGGPLNISSVTFTTGTPDLYAGVEAKQQVGPLAFTGSVGYLVRFSSVVQYLVETTNLQFAGRIKPGDQIRATAGVMAQAGPLYLEAKPVFEYRMATKVGTTSPGVTPSRTLKPIADSSGYALDLRGELGVDVTRGFGVSAYGVLPLMGQDLQFFPIEDLQPTLGPTFGGTVEGRF